MKRRGELIVGVLASAGAVVLVTAAIAVVKRWVPVLSLGVLYIFAVLPVAVAWGLALATAVSIASMLAFNWFFLPPTHTFQLRDGANWAVLAVYLVTAVVVSALAAQALRRSDTLKTALLHAVSHDLRSPLTAILAAASGLGNPDVRLARSDRDDLVATVRADAERLKRIVGHPLHISRLHGRGAA